MPSTAAKQGFRKALLCACVAGRLCNAGTPHLHQLAKILTSELSLHTKSSYCSRTAYARNKWRLQFTSSALHMPTIIQTPDW